MWDQPAAFSLGRRDVIGSWLRLPGPYDGAVGRKGAQRIPPIFGLHPLALGTITDNRCPASTRLNGGEQGLLGLICGYASRGGRTRLLAECAALFRPTPL